MPRTLLGERRVTGVHGHWRQFEGSSAAVLAWRVPTAAPAAAEGSLDMGRRWNTVLSGGKFQPSFEVRLDNLIPQRLFGATALVVLGIGDNTFDDGIHEASPS